MNAVDIGGAMERTAGRLTEDESAGRGTRSAEAVLEDGLCVRVEGPNDFVLTTDMSSSVGGGESGPSPASLARAALASCDATVVAMRAAQEGIELSSLEVTVEWEYDSRGMLGVDDSIPPGPLAVRVHYRLGVDGVPVHRLEELVAWAEDHSPVGDVFRRALDYETEVEVV